MKLPAFLRRAAPAAPPRTDPLAPYICLYHYLVDIVFEYDDPHRPTMDGVLATSQRSEGRHTVLWHRDVFHRDDIEDATVQNGCKSIKVSGIVRRYYPETAVRIVSSNDRLMVIACPGDHNAYIAGFARDLVTAQRYVALGDCSALYLPWEATP